MPEMKIGGRRRLFSLDFASFRVAERRHGVRVEFSDFSNMALGDVAKYLWIGLLASDHDLTEMEVLGWFVSASVAERKEYARAVMEDISSLGDLFPSDADEEAEVESPGKPSIGGKSNLSPTGS